MYVCVPYMYVCMYTRTYVHTYIPHSLNTVLHKLQALFQLENFFKGGKDMSQGIRGRGMEANLCACMCVST